MKAMAGREMYAETSQASDEDIDVDNLPHQSCCQKACSRIFSAIARPVASTMYTRKIKKFISKADADENSLGNIWEASSKEILEHLDFLSQFVIMNVYQTTQKHSPVEDIWVPQEQTFFDETNTHFIPELEIYIPDNDEQSSSADSTKTGVRPATLRKSQWLSVISIDDDIHPACYFKTLDEGKTFCKDLLYAFLYGQRSHDRMQMEADNFSASKPIFMAPHTDAAQSDLAYFGMGQVLLRCSNRTDLGEHMVDLCDLADLNVRPAFERYGACAYFRYPSRELTAIYWSHGDKLVTPSDQDWEHAKWAWRCSLFLWVTGVDHLVHIHLIVSNALSSSIRGLPPDHPIRRLMHICSFGNAKVNSEAFMALYPMNGVFHNATALEWEGGLQDVFINAGQEYRYESFSERCRNCSLPEQVKKEMPLYSDGLRMYQSISKFVTGYVDLYYKDDAAVLADQGLRAYWTFDCVPQYTRGLPPLSKAALVTQLADAAFYVSVYHQIVGDVIRYMKVPSNMCWQIREGEDYADARAITLAMAIGCRTMRDMPEFEDDWFFPCWKTHLQIPGNTPQVQARVDSLLKAFQGEINQLAGEFDLKNQQRPEGTRPRFYCTSVSL